MLHDRQVVGDEQIGEAEPVLQVEQQVDDLRLDRDVERRDRLVGDDQRRVQRERAGDADALALAAGERVREAVHVGGRQLHQVEQLAHPPPALLERAHAVDQQRLGDDVGDRHARVERRERVLEDHLHLAPQRPQLGLRQGARRRPGCPTRSGSGWRPRSASSARRMQREVVVLPQPLSPTSERVSPRRIVKLTSSTARTWPTTRPQQAAADREPFLQVLDLEDGRRAPPSPRLLHEARHRRGRAGFVLAIEKTARLAAGVERHGVPAGSRSQTPAIASGQRGWKGQPGGRA